DGLPARLRRVPRSRSAALPGRVQRPLRRAGAEARPCLPATAAAQAAGAFFLASALAGTYWCCRHRRRARRACLAVRRLPLLVAAGLHADAAAVAAEGGSSQACAQVTAEQATA